MGAADDDAAPPGWGDAAVLATALGVAAWLTFAAGGGALRAARAAWSRWRRWELLELDEREIDLAPLGLERRFVLRQEFVGRCAPSADSLGTGGALWGGALELSSFLLHEADRAGVRLAGARVVELGAGLGLTSMVACIAGSVPPARLVVTDGHAPVVERAQAAVDVNLTPAEVKAAGLSVERLGWGDTEGIAALLGGGGGAFDIIMGADIVYHPAPLPLLLETVLALCGAQTCVCIAYTPRGNVVARQHNDAFFEDLSLSFVSCELFHAKDLQLARVKGALDRKQSDSLSGGGDFTEVGDTLVR